MLVANLDHGEAVVQHIKALWKARGRRYLAIDFETMGKPPHDRKDALIYDRQAILVMTVAYYGHSYAFPTSWSSHKYPDQEVWGELLKEIFYDESVVKVFHNGNYDAGVITTALDMPEMPNIWCTLIGGWAASEYIDKSLKDRAPLLGRFIRATATINFDKLAELAAYGEDDVLATEELYQLQEYGEIIRPPVLEHVGWDKQRHCTKAVRMENPWPAGRIEVPNQTLDAQRKRWVKELELPVLYSAMRAERRGFSFNLPRLRKIRAEVQEAIAQIRSRITRTAGMTVNPNSAKDMQAAFAKLKIKNNRKSKTGKPSFDAKALVIARDQHPFVALVLQARQMDKLASVYIGRQSREEGTDCGLEYFINPETKRIHTMLSTVGAITGRASSCVSGDTLLPTNRGLFRFDEYIPCVGDTVISHLGRECRVLCKLYKGVAPMFRVVLQNGSIIVVTAAHRLLTPKGWMHVGDLVVGSTVVSYERKLDQGSLVSNSVRCNAALSGVERSDGALGCKSTRYSHGHGLRDFAPNLGPEKIQGAYSIALGSNQTWSEESDVWPNWQPTPQLPRRDKRWPRLPSAEGERFVCFVPSAGNATATRAEENAEGICGAPYRRQPPQQPAQQLGVTYDGSAHSYGVSNETTSEIVALDPVGVQHVWDITVEGDESYCCQGFKNHNSNPNLQQIPNRKDQFHIRSCFWSGHKERALGVLDYAQLELRVMALCSKDPMMTKIMVDPKGDMHTVTAERFKCDRVAAKQLNFLLQYGGRAFALAEQLNFMGIGMTEAQVQAYADIYAETYAGVVYYRKQLLEHHRAHDFVRLFLGRTRHLPDIDWNNSYSVHKAETTTSNNVIQGTGQDFLKAAIVRADSDNANPDQRMLDNYVLPKKHRLILKDYSERLEKYRRTLRKARSRFILQVHDEVLFTCDKAAAAECLNIWCTIMTWRHFFPAISGYNVPLVAEGGWGMNWEQAKSDKGQDHIKLGYEEWARYAE